MVLFSLGVIPKRNEANFIDLQSYSSLSCELSSNTVHDLISISAIYFL